MRATSPRSLVRRFVPALALGILACGSDPPAGTAGSTTDGSSSGSSSSTTPPTTGPTSSSGTTTDACPLGSEGCACTQGGGCDPGLVCLSMLCVDPGGTTSTTDAVTSSTTGTSTDASAGSTGSTSTTDGTGSTGTTGGMGGWDGDYPSCAGLAADACGGDDCCATDEVPGGWFAMGRGEHPACPDPPVDGDPCTQTTLTCFDTGITWGCPTGVWIDLGGDDEDAGGADEVPERSARVSFYGLDRYEVTVARMRPFVDAYEKAALLALLKGGAGTHPKLPETAWSDAWDTHLPADSAALREALKCNATQTWTDAPDTHETYPINCASWYLAYAFCAWDEARLPTEAEWERAAVGGAENRLYPWGTDAPSATLANYKATDNTPHADVFAKPDGAGRWGHLQIAGSVWEWVLDTHDPGYYAGAGNDCQDCVNMGQDGARVMRGGDFQYNAINLRGAERFPGTPGAYWLGAGIRCARD